MANGQPEHDGHHQPSRRSVTSRASVLIPAATFAAGVLIGALVMGVGDTDDGSSAVDDSASLQPTPPPGGTAVVVPAACEEAAAAINRAADLLQDAARSVRDFDPDRLVQVLDELETTEPMARELARQCAAIDVTPAATPSS